MTSVRIWTLSVWLIFAFLGIRPVMCCFGVVFTATNTAQNFQSPGYPTAYSSNENCSWSITAVNTGRKLGLEFTDSVLEDSGLCASDSVDVYDGYSASSPHLIKFCGTMKPTLTSTGEHLFVVFRSDGVGHYKGFQASVSQKPVESNSLSFESIMAIIGSVTLLLLLTIIIIACAHRAWSRKIKDRVSNLNVAHKQKNKIVPLDSKNSFPVLPDKPIEKTPKPRRDREQQKPAEKQSRPKDTVVTIVDLESKQSFPILPSKPVHVTQESYTTEEQPRLLKRERVKVGNIPVPKRAEVVDDASEDLATHGEASGSKGKEQPKRRPRDRGAPKDETANKQRQPVSKPPQGQIEQMPKKRRGSQLPTSGDRDAMF